MSSSRLAMSVNSYLASQLRYQWLQAHDSCGVLSVIDDSHSPAIELNVLRVLFMLFNKRWL